MKWNKVLVTGGRNYVDKENDYALFNKLFEAYNRYKKTPTHNPLVEVVTGDAQGADAEARDAVYKFSRGHVHMALTTFPAD